VILDYELKRDYQQFLHERNRGRKDPAARVRCGPAPVRRGRSRHGCLCRSQCPRW
jgi:hypothetical protein